MGMKPLQSDGRMHHMGKIQTMHVNSNESENVPPQMNKMVPGQMGQLGAGQIQQNMQFQVQNQLPDQIQDHITGPIVSIQTSTRIPQQLSQIDSGQLGRDQMQQQLNHIQRKPGEMMNTGFHSPHNVTPNQFLRQNPSPSAPSLARLLDTLNYMYGPSPSKS